MEYMLTVNSLHPHDTDKAGMRAVDLAVLSKNHFKTPLCFFLGAAALEKFVEHNNLKQKGAELLGNGNYEGLRQEFLNGAMPEVLVSEIKEAYATLSVDEEQDASNIVGSDDTPFVNVIISPNYDLSNDDYSGIIQNVRGIDQLVNAVKTAWASLFSQQSFSYRESVEVGEFFAGVIVQTMPKSVVSGFASASSKEEIVVRTWYGYPDYSMEFEKDYFEVSKDTLQILKHEVRHQTQRLIRDDEGNLTSIPLDSRGADQKIDDKAIIELGRLAKKMSSYLASNTDAIFTFDKKGIFLLLVNRTGEMPGETSKPGPAVLNVPPPEDPESGPELEMPSPEQGLEIPSPDSPEPENPVLDVPSPQNIPAPTESESMEKEEILMPESEEDFLHELEGAMPQVQNQVEEVSETVSDEADSEELESFPEEDSYEDQAEDSEDYEENTCSEEPQAYLESSEYEEGQDESELYDAEASESESYGEPESSSGMESPWKEQVEEIDERLEHVNHLKNKVEEFDRAFQQGDEDEMRQRLEEVEDAVRRLKQ